MSVFALAAANPTWADFAAGWPLFRVPVLCAVVAGALLGFLSAYIVIRRMVFVSAAVSQSAGLGVALSFYVGIHWGVEVGPATGAILLSLACAAFLVWDPKRFGLTREALLGIVFAFAGAAAVIVGSKITQEAHDIHSILFGSGVLVEEGDYDRVRVAAAVLLTLHVWWFRGLAFASFDPIGARVSGLPVRLLDGFILVSIGVAVGVSANALGALPVFALSTLPAAAAVLLFRRRLAVMFACASLIGAAAGGLGYLVAFFKDLPVGASQSMVAIAFLLLASVVRGARLAGLRRRR